MLIRDEDPDPREDEIENDDRAPVDGPDPDDEPEIEASDEDEPADDDQEQVDDEPVEEPVQRRRQPTKDENMAALRAKARRADELEAEVTRLRTTQPQQTQPVQQGETPQARHARLAAMSPEDRVNAIADEREERLHRTAALADFRVAEAEDRGNFNEICRADPRAKKYAPQVEQTLLAERQAGRNWPRATILKFILGERVMANAPKAKKQQAAADENAKRQGGRPEKSKGDVGGSNKRLTEAQAREKRLLNVRI